MAFVLIDTATARAVVAIVDDARAVVLAQRYLLEPQRHAEALAACVAGALRDAGRSECDVVGVGVGVGPGSFIGVRTGIAFALGLGRARGVPVVGVAGLVALAASAGAAPSTPIVAVVDAKRGERYVGRVVLGPTGVIASGVPRAVAPSDVSVGPDELAVGAIDGIAAARAVALAGPTAEGLRIAFAWGADARAEPVYVRDADAKVPAIDPAARRAQVLNALDADDARRTETELANDRGTAGGRGGG